VSVIVGGRITGVNAVKKNDEPAKGMNVNVNVEDLRAEKNLLVIKYEFKITYSPDNAEIVVKGELIADEDEKKRREIEDEWKKKKFLPTEFAEDVITAITYAGTATGTLAAYALNIGAPINIPRAKLSAPEKKGKAS